jgi:hypothetical protein
VDNSQFGGDSKVITNHLQIGTNFAISAKDKNEKGVHYYLLAILRPRFHVDIPFIGAWGNKFRGGNYAIEYMHYQKSGLSVPARPPGPHAHPPRS